MIGLDTRIGLGGQTDCLYLVLALSDPGPSKSHTCRAWFLPRGQGPKASPHLSSDVLGGRVWCSPCDSHPATVLRGTLEPSSMSLLLFYCGSALTFNPSLNGSQLNTFRCGGHYTDFLLQLPLACHVEGVTFGVKSHPVFCRVQCPLACLGPQALFSLGWPVSVQCPS